LETENHPEPRLHHFMKNLRFSIPLKSVLLAAGMLAGGLFASFGAGTGATVVSLGSASVQLVTPAGYLDCSGENDQISNLAGNFCPPENRLLGVFVSPEFRHGLLAGDTTASFDYVMVETPRTAVWSDISDADFTEAKTSVKNAQAEAFAQADADTKDAINSLNHSLQAATGADVRFNLAEPVSLGVFDESARHVSMLMLMRMQMQAGGATQQINVAASISLVHLKGKVLFAYSYRTYTGEKSVQALKKMTSDWTAALEKANP